MSTRDFLYNDGEHRSGDDLTLATVLPTDRDALVERVLSAPVPDAPRGDDLTLYSDDELALLVDMVTPELVADFQAEIDRRVTVVPTLVLVDGRVMIEETGEFVDVQDTEVATALFGDTLAAYERAEIKATALAMQLRDMEDAWLAKLRGGEDYKAIAAQRQTVRNTLARIEAVFGGMLGDRDAKVSIDTGRALVTWGKPRESWTLAKPPSWYATEGACHNLAGRLSAAFPGMGRQEALSFAVIVREWLSPTAKVSEPGVPSITVRANGAGR